MEGFIRYFRKNGDLGKLYPLSLGSTTIGASLDAADVRLKVDHPNLEDIHCIINVNDDGIATILNKSKEAPVLVNNAPVKNARVLCHGDKFDIVGKVFQYINDYQDEQIIDKKVKVKSVRMSPSKSERRSVMPLLSTKGCSPKKSPSTSSKLPAKITAPARNRLSLTVRNQPRLINLSKRKSVSGPVTPRPILFRKSLRAPKTEMKLPVNKKIEFLKETDISTPKKISFHEDVNGTSTPILPRTPLKTPKALGHDTWDVLPATHTDIKLSLSSTKLTDKSPRVATPRKSQPQTRTSYRTPGVTPSAMDSIVEESDLNSGDEGTAKVPSNANVSLSEVDSIKENKSTVLNSTKRKSSIVKSSPVEESRSSKKSLQLASPDVRKSAVSRVSGRKSIHSRVESPDSTTTDDHNQPTGSNLQGQSNREEMEVDEVSQQTKSIRKSRRLQKDPESPNNSFELSDMFLDDGDDERGSSLQLSIETQSTRSIVETSSHNGVPVSSVVKTSTYSSKSVSMYSNSSNSEYVNKFDNLDSYYNEVFGTSDSETSAEKLNVSGSSAAERRRQSKRFTLGNLSIGSSEETLPALNLSGDSNEDLDDNQQAICNSRRVSRRSAAVSGQNQQAGTRSSKSLSDSSQRDLVINLERSKDYSGEFELSADDLVSDISAVNSSKRTSRQIVPVYEEDDEVEYVTPRQSLSVKSSETANVSQPRSNRRSGGKSIALEKSFGSAYTYSPRAELTNENDFETYNNVSEQFVTNEVLEQSGNSSRRDSSLKRASKRSSELAVEKLEGLTRRTSRKSVPAANSEAVEVFGTASKSFANYTYSATKSHNKNSVGSDEVFEEVELNRSNISLKRANKRTSAQTPKQSPQTTRVLSSRKSVPYASGRRNVSDNLSKTLPENVQTPTEGENYEVVHENSAALEKVFEEVEPNRSNISLKRGNRRTSAQTPKQSPQTIRVVSSRKSVPYASGRRNVSDNLSKTLPENVQTPTENYEDINENSAASDEVFEEVELNRSNISLKRANRRSFAQTPKQFPQTTRVVSSRKSVSYTSGRRNVSDNLSKTLPENVQTPTEVENYEDVYENSAASDEVFEEVELKRSNISLKRANRRTSAKTPKQSPQTTKVVSSRKSVPYASRKRNVSDNLSKTLPENVQTPTEVENYEDAYENSAASDEVFEEVELNRSNISLKRTNRRTSAQTPKQSPQTTRVVSSRKSVPYASGSKNASDNISKTLPENMQTPTEGSYNTTATKRKVSFRNSAVATPDNCGIPELKCSTILKEAFDGAHENVFTPPDNPKPSPVLRKSARKIMIPARFEGIEKTPGLRSLIRRSSVAVEIDETNTPERKSDVSETETETPKSTLKPRRTKSFYNPPTEEITPVTPIKTDELGEFKTPINTPGLFESLKQSVMRSRKRRRESSNSVVRSSKKMKLCEDDSTIDEQFESDTPISTTSSNVVNSKNIRKILDKKEHSPKNNLSDVRGVKRLMATPLVMKSPKNSLSDVAGVKKLFQTPRSIVSPKNDLTNVPNLRSIMSPKVQNSPRNDLTKIPNIRRLMSPKLQNSPKNDLTRVPNLRKVMYPRAEKSPLNDLTKVPNLRRVMSPKNEISPKNDLSSPKGVKKLMSTPTVQREPVNDLSDVEGVEEMFNVSGVNVLHHGSDLENCEELFDKLAGRPQFRTYRPKSMTPKKALPQYFNRRKTIGDVPGTSPRVEKWVLEQNIWANQKVNLGQAESEETNEFGSESTKRKLNKEELSGHNVPQRARRPRRGVVDKELIDESNSIPTKKTRQRKPKVDDVEVVSVPDENVQEKEFNQEEETDVQEIKKATRGRKTRQPATRTTRRNPKNMEESDDIENTPTKRTRQQKAKADDLEIVLVSDENVEETEFKQEEETDTQEIKQTRRGRKPRQATRTTRRNQKDMEVLDDIENTPTKGTRQQKEKAGDLQIVLVSEENESKQEEETDVQEIKKVTRGRKTKQATRTTERSKKKDEANEGHNEEYSNIKEENSSQTVTDIEKQVMRPAKGRRGKAVELQTPPEEELKALPEITQEEKKTRRGRPKKTVAETSEAGDQEPEVRKTARGRKAKTVQEGSGQESVDDVVPSEIIEGPKKLTRRQKKTDTEIKDEKEDATDATIEPKGTRRTRKGAVKEVETPVDVESPRVLRTRRGVVANVDEVSNLDMEKTKLKHVSFKEPVEEHKVLEPSRKSKRTRK